MKDSVEEGTERVLSAEETWGLQVCSRLLVSGFFKHSLGFCDSRDNRDSRCECCFHKLCQLHYIGFPGTIG